MTGPARHTAADLGRLPWFLHFLARLFAAPRRPPGAGLWSGVCLLVRQ